MSEETGAASAQAGEVSDGDLLTIIRHPGAYSAEISAAARLEAQLRGLVGRFEDAGYKVVTPDGREDAPLDVVTLKGMYLRRMIGRDTPVYVASHGQWLPLAQVFDVNRWEMTKTAGAESDHQAAAPPWGPSRPAPRRQTAARDSSPYANGMNPLPSAHSPLQPASSATTANASTSALPGSPAYANSLQPRGVGGWLLLFILGQLACKPLNTCAALTESTSYQMYPITNFVVSLEFLLSLGMLIFGIVVGLALLRSTDEGAVHLTRKYLLTLLGVAVFDVFLVHLTDAPPYLRDNFIARASASAIYTGIYVLIWYQYFKRSKRVEATYFSDEENPPAGGGLTTIRLN